MASTTRLSVLGFFLLAYGCTKPAGHRPPGLDDDGAFSELAAELLAAHNQVRAEALPTPSPALASLSWDDELAAIAQDWAAGCRFEHSNNSLGENLALFSADAPGTSVVQGWASEASSYDYGSDSCLGVCGHYTQIVWRNTARVGCGVAQCDDVVGGFGAGFLWVCNYDPPGNYIGQRPY